MLEAALVRADYERLRADALAGGAHGWRWGRSLLARGGLPAWLAGWSERAAAGMNRPPARVTPSAGAASASAVPDAAPLVSLLALMLLPHTGYTELVAS